MHTQGGRTLPALCSSLHYYYLQPDLHRSRMEILSAGSMIKRSPTIKHQLCLGHGWAEKRRQNILSFWNKKLLQEMMQILKNILIYCCTILMHKTYQTQCTGSTTTLISQQFKSEPTGIQKHIQQCHSHVSIWDDDLCRLQNSLSSLPS